MQAYTSAAMPPVISSPGWVPNNCCHSAASAWSSRVTGISTPTAITEPGSA